MIPDAITWLLLMASALGGILLLLPLLWIET